MTKTFFQGRQFLPDSGKFGKIENDCQNFIPMQRSVRKNPPPWIDDHAVSEKFDSERNDA